MNKYIFIRRLTGPSILLLLGIVALLHQAHLVHFSIFIPLLLILLGVLKLAERAVLASEPHPAIPYPYAGAAVPPPGTAVPAPGQEERSKDREGGIL
ncbi:MAG: hypothetical protein ACLGPM_03580 [Acidobacteriota bacterium]